MPAGGTAAGRSYDRSAPDDPGSASPLAVWERDGLAAALAKAGLPADDICAARPLFWRFENDDVPVGFGGLEIFGDQALLRSVVTLPPVRNRGIGTAIVTTLEAEANIRGCSAVWLVTERPRVFSPVWATAPANVLKRRYRSARRCPSRIPQRRPR